MRIPVTAIAATLLAIVFSASAPAATWQSVAVSGGERVEIDKARIMRIATGKTVAWTRLVLGRELADANGSYSVVQAMNRYDCQNHTFATLERVYMSGANGDKAVREEKIRSPKEIVASGGSADEKLLVEACKLRTVGEANKVAEEVAKLISPVPEGKPGVMYADMRTAGDTPSAHTVPVADAGKPELKTEVETRPNSAAETKIEIRAPSERPRFIGLPKMEKPQAESPQASAKAPEARAEAGKGVARVADKPGEKIAPAPIETITARHERERRYATSGPRRAPVATRSRLVEQPGVAVMQHHDLDWSYEGEGSPANWGKLKGEFATCATGRRQSPIDIREGIRVDLEPIQFDYKRTQFRVVDNGHTIQVNVGEGSTISILNRIYQLRQFHFHRPAEERINGKAFDMVIHLEHRDDQGKIAMVAVLLEKGAENPLIQTLWNNMPLEVNQDVIPSIAIDLNGLLPENRGYYTYMGSMTTPPCTEDVLWMVFKQPLPVSAEQVGIFSRLYKNNARPIQPANSRLIKENR